MRGMLIVLWMGLLVAPSVSAGDGIPVDEGIPGRWTRPQHPTTTWAQWLGDFGTIESAGNTSVLLVSLTVDVTPMTPGSAKPDVESDRRSDREPTDPDVTWLLALGMSRETPWDDWENRDGILSGWEFRDQFDR